MHKLYHQNKNTTPDQKETWLHLLRKPSQTHVDIPYKKDTIDEYVNSEENTLIDDQVDIAEDSNTLVDNNVKIPTEKDDFFLSSDPSDLERKTRSGKTYHLKVFPKKILKKPDPNLNF